MTNKETTHSSRQKSFLKNQRLTVPTGQTLPAGLNEVGGTKLFKKDLITFQGFTEISQKCKQYFAA